MLRTLHEEYALAWLQISTISLFTLIGSLIYLLNYISTRINYSRSRLETVCGSLNTISEQIYNAPSILLQASMNSVNTAKENIHRNLSTAIDVVENVTVWLVSMYKSTYRCLLGLAIRSIFLVVTRIAGPIQQVAESVTSFLHIGESSTIPLDWTQSLNNTQARVDEWFRKEDETIRLWVGKPFNLLQTQLNTTFDSWKPPSMNKTLITNNSSNTFQLLEQQPCQSDQLLSAINQVEQDITYFIYILIGVLVGLVATCTVVNLIVIHFRHHQVAQARALFIKVSQTDIIQSTQDLLDKYIWTILTTMLPWQKRRQKLHQLLHFMSHHIIVYCLVVGIAGLCMTYGLSWLIETKSQEIYAEFAAKTQEWTTNATAEWTSTASNQFSSINEWLNKTELDLNDHAFGIIKSSAIAINDTLTNVVDQIHSLIQTVLGGTLFEAPAKELTQCLLLTRIENIEQGLTWIVSISAFYFTEI